MSISLYVYNGLMVYIPKSRNLQLIGSLSLFKCAKYTFFFKDLLLKGKHRLITKIIFINNNEYIYHIII